MTKILVKKIAIYVEVPDVGRVKKKFRMRHVISHQKHAVKTLVVAEELIIIYGYG